jgi:hypothetical protein
MPTLSIDGTVTFPLAGEATGTPRSFSAELIYTQRAIQDVELVGVQSNIDLMGLIAEAKACYIEVIAGDGQLKINGASQTLDISMDGGFWVWLNPNGGLTALTVSTSADATFRVYLFA